MNENSGSTNPDQQKRLRTFLIVVTSQKFWLEIFFFLFESIIILSQFIFLLKLYRYLYYYYY